MPYCEISDVQIAVGGAAALIQLSDQEDDGAVNEPVVERAIARAQGLIDEYLSKQFAVPLDPVPDALRYRTAELAAHFLREWRHGPVTTSDRDYLTITIEWLQAVAKGEVSLGVDPAPAKHSTRVDAVTERSDSLDVSRRKLRGFW